MKKINAVLVIDDDHVYCFLIRRVIQKSGITDRVIFAKDGLDAIKKMSEFSPKENICPELILVDVEMPVMDGLEFVENFNKLEFVNKDQVKLIINSFTINPLIELKLKLLNINQYIQKPLSEHKLKEIVAVY